MTAAASPPSPDTTDMKAVHQIFRKAFGTAQQTIGIVAHDDTARVEKVGGYYQEIMDLLHLHPEGEDLLVWPKLLERSPETTELVSRIAAQHEGVYDGAGRAESALAAWRTDPNDGSRAALVEALTALDALLTAHLDEEEEQILPICAAHFTMEDWGQLPAHAMTNYRGDRIWLVLGLVYQNMTPPQRDALLANLPPPALEMWNNFGRQASAEFIADMGHALSLIKI